jgi:hypothetical protein
MNNRNAFLIVLKAGSSRSNCWFIWYLVTSGPFPGWHLLLYLLQKRIPVSPHKGTEEQEALDAFYLCIDPRYKGEPRWFKNLLMALLLKLSHKPLHCNTWILEGHIEIIVSTDLWMLSQELKPNLPIFQ